MSKTVKFSGVKDGATFQVVGMEFIKFPDVDGKTPVVMKDIAFRSRFGDNNDLRTSDVLKRMEKRSFPRFWRRWGKRTFALCRRTLPPCAVSRPTA